MRSITDYFSISTEYSSPSDIEFPDNSILLYTTSAEERSTLFASTIELQNNVHKIFINENADEVINLKSTSIELTLNLRSNTDSETLTSMFKGNPVFIDITGLNHSTWAWLVRSILLREDGNFWVMYSEPSEYKFDDSSFDRQLFDLSERITGIAPLPSFASLTKYTSENSIFMPLLGFEGTRLAHIFEDVQPSRQFTFPVIGVPGFKFDFPFYAYQGNKQTLEREGVWRNYRYEKANCPVSIYILGLSLLEEFSDKYLRIALIGTKPHALGAVLLKILHPTKIDLIYDHPIRKKGRTKGKSKILCYYLTPFKQYAKV